jgi:hypothetical protein
VNGLFYHIGMDFLTSYTAADVLVTGDASNLYDTRVQWEHQRTIVQQYGVEWPDRVMHPYVSPPLLAAVAVPFLLMSPAVATLVWASLNSIAIAAAVIILCHRMQLAWPDAAVVVVGSMPLFYVLMLGQVEGLLFLAMVLFMTELRRDRDVRAGLALSVLAIKPPLLLAPMVYLFVLGRRRTIWTMIVAVAAQFVVSVALVGSAGVADYLRLSRRLAGPDGTIVTNVWGMVNVRAIVVRAFPADDGMLVNVVIAVLTALILGFAARLWRRSDEPVGAIALALLATTTVLTAYHALYHTSLIALLGSVLLIARARWQRDEVQVNRVIVISWLFFTLLPMLYFVVVQSSKVPAVMSTIGILVIMGMASHLLAQPAAAIHPSPSPTEVPEPAVLRRGQGTWGN